VWNMLPVLLITSAMFAFVLLWLRGFEVSIENDAIYYSTLFRRKRGLSLAEIATARMEWGWSASDKRHRPFLRLVIQPYAETGKEPVEIDLAPFTRRSIQPVLDFLGPKMSDRKMRRGRARRN
jgi:hypothetical protein